MKKNNPYLVDDEIDLGSIIKSLWKEKILILSISIICGLAGYLYASFQPQEFRTEIELKNPPFQIFEPYNTFNINNNNNNNSNNNNSNNNNSNNNNNNNNNIVGQFIFYFKLNLLSLDNIQNFIEESKDFDNFKGYLKSRNISVKQYFSDQKLSVEKQKNIIIPNKYFLNHSKELDGSIFLNKYVEFINKKTIVEFKNVTKLSILNTINHHQEALEIAKKVQLENPIIKTANQNVLIIEPEALFYKGTKVLTEYISNLNKKMMKLENDQFVFNIISQKAITSPNDPKSLPLYFALGLMLGLFLSLVIIFFKGILKNN